MNKRELLIVGSTLSLITLSLIVTTFYPAMSVAQSRRPKKPIPGNGVVRASGLGVYWDVSCTSAVSSIDWGVIDAGSEVNRTVYIRNQGDASVTLGMATQNWTPSNSSAHISLTWDYAGQTLAVGEVIGATFTLSVSENAQQIRDFSFETVIAGV